MSVTAAEGFVAAGCHAGVKRRRYSQAGRALRVLARHYPIGLLSTPAIVLHAMFGWIDFVAGWDGWDGLV